MTIGPDTFDWPALMQLGLRTLALPPRTFWSLTPVELAIMAGLEDGSAPMDRDALRRLAERYPDGLEDHDD